MTSCRCAVLKLVTYFIFGTKISAAMGSKGEWTKWLSVPVHMGSYGIGVSRLVGGIIEANHDDRGIVWPESISTWL